MEYNVSWWQHGSSALFQIYFNLNNIKGLHDSPDWGLFRGRRLINVLLSHMSYLNKKISV